MSNAQIPKPPRKIESPIATINHISVKICESLLAFAWSSDFDKLSVDFCGVVPYFLFNDGRMFTSMTYMLRKRTIAVMRAKAFW
jgi:hypothetical protein